VACQSSQSSQAGNFADRSLTGVSFQALRTPKARSFPDCVMAASFGIRSYCRSERGQFTSKSVVALAEDNFG